MARTISAVLHLGAAHDARQRGRQFLLGRHLRSDRADCAGYSGPSQDGSRADKAVSFQLVKDVVDRDWVSHPRVNDLLDAGPDGLPIDINLIATKLSGDLALRSHGAS
jgi:hypothetical protein